MRPSQAGDRFDVDSTHRVIRANVDSTSIRRVRARALRPNRARWATPPAHGVRRTRPAQPVAGGCGDAVPAFVAVRTRPSVGWTTVPPGRFPVAPYVSVCGCPVC